MSPCLSSLFTSPSSSCLFLYPHPALSRFLKPKHWDDGSLNPQERGENREMGWEQQSKAVEESGGWSEEAGENIG